MTRPATQRPDAAQPAAWFYTVAARLGVDRPTARGLAVAIAEETPDEARDAPADYLRALAELAARLDIDTPPEPPVGSVIVARDTMGPFTIERDDQGWHLPEMRQRIQWSAALTAWGPLGPAGHPFVVVRWGPA